MIVTLVAPRGNKIDPALVQKALEAIEQGDAKTAYEVLKGILASAAGAAPAATDETLDAVDGDADGSEGDGAEGIAPPKKVAKNSKLTPQQIAICAERGITPATFVAVRNALNRPITRTKLPR